MWMLAVALMVIFTIAKIAGYLAWSWWIVFSPVIVAVALVLLALFGIGGLAVWANKQ